MQKTISFRWRKVLRSQTGFSLAELVIVISVIAILIAVAVPAFLSWLPNMRLKSDARNVVSSIQKAKVEAIKRNQCVGISFSTVVYPATGGNYVVFLDDGSGGGTRCDGFQNGSEASLASTSVDKDVSLISASFTGSVSSISFNSQAFVCGCKFGNIQLRNNQSRWYKVTLTGAGGIRLDMSGDGVTWN